MTTEKEYEERFWTKVDKENSDIFYDGIRCWEWTEGLSPYGYGMYRRNGHNIFAHRYSYLLKFGEFDTKLYVLHHCDNRKCVNPSHLFLGTQLDNMRDMAKKERGVIPVGENHGNSKLTEKNVIKIYKMYDSGNYTQREIAKALGVDFRTINYVVNGKSWNHIFTKLERKLKKEKKNDSESR